MSEEKSNFKSYVVFAVILLLLFLVFKVFIFGSMGYSMVVIDNDDPNSMYPTYFQGDMFIIQKIPAQDIKIGDIVVYEDSRGQSIIHRVIDIVHLKVGNSDFYYYRVKGDNPITNSIPDYRGVSATAITLIAYSQIQGVVKYRVPSLGLYNLAKDVPGTGLMYLLGIGLLFIGLFFWPETPENKEKHETKDKNKKYSFSKLIVKLHPKKQPIAFTVILILLVSFIFIYAYAYIPQGDNTVESLAITNGPITIHDRIGTYKRNVTFIQISGTFNFAQSFTTKVNVIEVHITDKATGSLLNITVWKSLRLIRGEATIGLSGCYDTSLVTMSGNQYTLLITVIMYNTAFGRYSPVDQGTLEVSLSTT